MESKKITAIVRRSVLEEVESRLQQEGVNGISVCLVKGWGEYANFFSQNWQVTHAKIEIFSDRVGSERITDAILNGAHSGGKGDGLVAVSSVEKVYRIRTRAEAEPGEI